MPPKPPDIWRAATAWPGKFFRPGYSTCADQRWPREMLGNRLRASPPPCARAETSVRMPRSSSQASNAPGTPPELHAQRLDALPMFVFGAVASAPPIRSEWPLRYFVAECITMSAPRSSGRVNTGVADGRIDREPRAGGMRDLGDRRKIGDLPAGIGRRLRPDELGLDLAASRP